MATPRYDFEIEQGADFNLAFARKDDQGVAIDMTGFAARMQIRQNVSSPTVLLELTTENGRLVIDGALGRVRVALTAADTAAIGWRKGVYDLELVSPTGSVRRLLSGVTTISREVTR